MSSKTSKNTQEHKRTETKKDARKSSGSSGKPDWMVDPKKAAMSRARNRNLRGCYSVVFLLAIVLLIGAMVYVTVR